MYPIHATLYTLLFDSRFYIFDMDAQENNTSEATTVVPEVAQTTPEISEVSSTETPSVENKTPFYKNTQLMGAIVAAVIILGGAGYYVYSTQYAKGGVIATVNGEKIYQADLAENIDRMNQGALAQGVDIADPAIKVEIEKQAYQVLIDNALLLGAADKAGIEASKEEITAKYDELVAQIGGEEVLTTQLTESGVTMDELQANIKERVIVDKYLESVTDIESLTVTDEEITQFLAGFPSETLPPLEEIRPQVEEQILNQKRQEILGTHIKQLNEEAEIVTK
jgi:hypothetical protein